MLLEVSKGNSLRSQLDALDIHYEQFYRELEASPELRERYAHARRMQAENHAGRINALSQDVLDGKYDANAARVALDAMKWTAAKLHPAVYGDKIQTEVTGKDGGPLIVHWKQTQAPSANG